MIEAAEHLDNDPRLAVIIIMRRARPRLTWRQIARRLRLPRSTVHDLATRNGIR